MQAFLTLIQSELSMAPSTDTVSIAMLCGGVYALYECRIARSIFNMQNSLFLK